MGRGLTLWLLVSLISISLVGNHPLWALTFGAMGGICIGVWIWQKTGQRKSVVKTAHPVVLWFVNNEVFLLIPAVLALLFSKRLPFPIVLLFLVLLLCVCFSRIWVFGHFSIPTPLNIPVLILLLLPATAGLYASPNLQSTLADVFSLVAGIVIFYVIVNNVRSETVFTKAVLGFICVGTVFALGALLVMQEPHVKLPVLGRFFFWIPDVLPRRVNPNYVGGMLVLFLPLSVWRLRLSEGRGKLPEVVMMGVVAIGLLMTQSRGALLGGFVALSLTLTWQFRWTRWIFLLFVAGVVALVYREGGGVAIDLVAAGSALHSWGGRMELWQRAIYIVQDFSFTGIGLHSFPIVVDLLYPLFLAGPDARVPHAHNLFLQVAVDMGFPGFVAFWMLLGGWGGMIWESLKRTQANLEMTTCRPLVLGLAGGMIAHLVYGIMDTIALGEKAGIVFWAVLALTVVVWDRVRSGESRESEE